MLHDRGKKNNSKYNYQNLSWICDKYYEKNEDKPQTGRKYLQNIFLIKDLGLKYKILITITNQSDKKIEDLHASPKI